MRLQAGENGWPGIFIPGEEAVALALSIRAILSLEVPVDLEHAFLRNLATCLELCQVNSDARKPKA